MVFSVFVVFVLFVLLFFFFFFFKQKTAYEMRISDWSSDVCSSDLLGFDVVQDIAGGHAAPGGLEVLGRDSQRERRRVVDLAVRVFGRRRGAQGYPRDRDVQAQRRVAELLESPGGFGQVKQIGRASCRERVCKYV